MLPSLVLLLVFLLVGMLGCKQKPSNNAGKLEGTRWSNEAGFIKKYPYPSDVIRMEFRGGGYFLFKVGGEQYTGKFKYGGGDTVYLNFDKPFHGSSSYVESIYLAGDRMTMSDPDGTSIKFMQRK